MPGDPLSAIYGDEALITMTPELKAELIQRFGLDKSLLQQFRMYLTSLIKGDFGYSYYYKTPIIDLLMGALPWTLLLVGLSLILSTFLGFILGLESAWNYGRKRDKGFLAGLMFLNGFPDFFIGIVLLLIFSVTLGIFPLSGALTPYAGYTGFKLLKDILWHLILPLSALVISEVSSCYLLTRTTVITVLGEPFILTAKAKGINDKSIMYRHVGKNSLLPIFTRTGLRAARMFTGALFVEIVFAYPGLGMLIFNSLMSRDYPVLQGIFFIVAVGVLGINFIVDMLYKKIDPRVV
jgi:peptide/nickel transport system permease protein